jgi:catalase
MTAEPVRYTPDVETVEPDEKETVREINQTFDTILERTAEDYGHAVRSVHAKAHGILKGELEIDANLPPELAQGLFAQAGKHPVYIRLSTNAGDILDDEISLPRGFALKVLDVEGERLPGADGTTQDFVMVNGPVFQAKTAKQFLSNLKPLAKTTDKLEGVKKAMSTTLRGVRHAIEAVGLEAPPKVTALGGAPQAEPLGATYYSVTPFRYGDYIAKFSIVPVTPEMKKLAEQEIEVRGREDAIREEVHNEMRVMDAEWEFRVQLCRDLDKQPVEDPTVKWDEEDAPFARVGVIRAPSQDSWEPAMIQAVDEEMRFGVWTGLAAHQPLGNINRARNEPYRHSADFRARVNACPYHEPASAGA